MEHSNRPQEPNHAKAVREYLLSTACTGEKFILPAFTFNYGVGLDPEAPVVTLILFGASTEGTNTWPGVLCLPPGAFLDTTDGAHRRGQLEAFALSMLWRSAAIRSVPATTLGSSRCFETGSPALLSLIMATIAAS